MWSVRSSFSLSNPTRLHEAQPKDLFGWCGGKTLTATGSTYPLVESNGQLYEIAECNNSEVFPGIGLGVVLSRAKLITREMLVAAVKALVAQSPALRDPRASLLPDVTNVRDISVQITAAVIKQAVQDGLAREQDFSGDHLELERWIKEQMWNASYRPLEKVSRDGASRAALVRW